MDLTQWTDGTVVMNGTHAAHSATDFEILSSVRADKDLASSPKNTLLSNDDNAMEPSPFYMLRYHRDRMLHAAKDFGWADTYSTIVGPSGLSYLRQALHSYLASISDRGNLPEPLKLRVAISFTGNISIASTPLPPVQRSSLFPLLLSPLPPSIGQATLQVWLVTLSPISASPSLFTRHKTTERSVYDEARSFIPERWPEAVSVDNLLSEILLMNQDDEVMEGSITTPYFRRGDGMPLKQDYALKRL
ncbi:MAG: hypothetical protein LQ344_000620 [Seirophora lacunosa]|nr:MAG: hypothetical protein LQ344_000620 [Seirophora lacunosa]